MIRWSYWCQIHALLARSGQLIRASRDAFQSCGAGTLVASSTAGSGVSVHGRSYIGASVTSGGIGILPTMSPCQDSTIRWVSVRWPMTAKSSSHFSKMRRASASRPGFSTISMRSWLSESMSS